MSYAIITGASSGIGYQLAKIFAENGHNLILIARQEERLRQVADELTTNNKINAVIIASDLGQPGAVAQIFSQLQEKSIPVQYLVNNAGFYVKGAFSQTCWEKEQELIQLQCLNHTQLVKLFLPGMLKQGKGGIINVCSTGSFAPGPYNAIYCAVKSFVLSYSEALAEEVAGSGITVTALCPGGTKTAFQDFSERKQSFFNPLMDASAVAKAGYRALMKGKRIVVPGWANKLQVFTVRFLPGSVVTKLARILVEKRNKK